MHNTQLFRLLPGSQLFPLSLLDIAFKSFLLALCKNCSVLHLGRKSPMHQYSLGNDCLESSFAEKALQSWWTANWLWRQHYAFMAKAVNSILGCIMKSVTSRSGDVRWFFPFLQHFWHHIQSGVPSSGLPSTRKTSTHEQVQWRATETFMVLEHLVCEERLRELESFDQVLYSITTEMYCQITFLFIIPSLI